MKYVEKEGSGSIACTQKYVSICEVHATCYSSVVLPAVVLGEQQRAKSDSESAVMLWQLCGFFSDACRFLA